VARLTILLLVTLVPGACGSGPGLSSSDEPADTAATVATDLEAAGATVSELGAFNTDPLGGRGVHLCVDGQQVSVFEFDTEAKRAATAARIDPTDPSNLGTAIIEWAGNPKFWQRDRILVLYLGSDPAVEAGITTVLGPPFARGEGRDPGPDRHVC
jgi:hypothetical protein